MIISPIDASADLAEVASTQHLFRTQKNRVFNAERSQGIRSESEQLETQVPFMTFPNAIVVVTEREILYLTRDWKFIPQLYPKPWPYSRHLIPSTNTLSIDIDRKPKRRLAGNVFMPFILAGNWFHILFDNYARLYFLNQLPSDKALRVGVPYWGCPKRSAIPSERAMVHASFLHGIETVRLEKGVYEIERLVAPPLANRDDYFLGEPVRFVAERLKQLLSGKAVSHPLRLFVSRADIAVRNLDNEAELAAQLRRLGFTILCPGDYSFQAQLEIFSAAEIIVGVHGQGLTPMISAHRCRVLMEFEAADWRFTAYRSIAKILGISYEKMPCKLIRHRNPGRFDWLATADIGASIAAVERVLESDGAPGAPS